LLAPVRVRKLGIFHCSYLEKPFGLMDRRRGMRHDQELLRSKLARLREMIAETKDTQAISVIQDMIAELELELRKIDESDASS
jgi:hypothetical protein